MSKPGRQLEAIKNLSRCTEIQVFNPKMRQYSQKRSSYIVKDLFPMYLFSKFNVEKHLKMIKYTRGILKVLGFSNIPIPVPDEIIDRIKSSCNNEEIIEAKFNEEEISKGDQITITDGPFEGLDAVVSGVLNDEQRIEVLVNLMKISINKLQIKKK